MELNQIHNEGEHASTSMKVILLVFAVILVGVLGYLVWQQNSAQDDTDYSVPKSAKKATTQTTKATPIACGDTTKYGFELTPDATIWKNYKVKAVLQKDMDPQPGYAVVTCYFTMPTTSTEDAWKVAAVDHAAGYASMFAISVYTPAQWTASQEEANKPTELGHTDAYYWGWSQAQATPTDLQAVYADSKNAVATFKIAQ